MPKLEGPRPFIRWAGGKRRLLPNVLAALPADFDLTKHRFYEPFVGGGAVTFRLAGTNHASGLPKNPARKARIVVNDSNSQLTGAYRVLRDRPDELIALLSQNFASRQGRNAYNAVRDEFNAASNIRRPLPGDELLQAARFLYLNRTGFNGLFRTNAEGNYNVPWGKEHIAVTKMCDAELLRACSDWLQRVEVRNSGFVASIEDVDAGDVVYLDPPYIPLSPTSAFSKYQADDFKDASQASVAAMIGWLTEKGARVILSNSDTERTEQLYRPHLETYRKVPVRRTISADVDSRGIVSEVLAMNYDIKDCVDPQTIAALNE